MNSKRIYITLTENELSLLEEKLGKVNSFSVKQTLLNSVLNNDYIRYKDIDNYINNLPIGEKFTLNKLSNDLNLKTGDKNIQSSIGKYLSSSDKLKITNKHQEGKCNIYQKI